MKGKDKKNLCRLYSAAMSLSMAATCFVLPVAAEEPVETEAPAAAVDLYPEPQSVVYDSTEGMSLEGPVDLVVHGTVTDTSLDRVKTILNEEGIEYQQVEAANPDHAQILISSDDAHCDVCGEIAEAALEEEQGYILYSDDDANKKVKSASSVRTRPVSGTASCLWTSCWTRKMKLANMPKSWWQTTPISNCAAL